MRAILLLAILLLAILFPLTASAEALWTEGPTTQITDESPLTFGAFSALAQRASPAVVAISSESVMALPEEDLFFSHPFFGHRRFGMSTPRQMPRRVGSGSGFIIRADGYILTNHHVIDGARKIKVDLLDGRSFEGKLIGQDPATDVALIKIDPGQETLPIAHLGDSDALKIGAWVVAIGNPLGLDHTVTAGIVSAKGRKEIRPSGDLRYSDFIQTDASINPGNSGGPLFNIRGEVVGINTAISARGQGIGFAIPINMVKQILPGLAKDGAVARSWIGVQIQAVTPALAKAFGLDRPRGALVADVVEGGPAATAGIKAGDIILEFDGRAIDEHDTLPWLASTAGVGKSVILKLLRDKVEREIKVKLGRMPGSGGDEADAEGRLGARLSSTEISGRRGVKIEALEPDGLAAREGLEAGDVILSCNGVAVETPQALRAALSRLKEGDLVRLLVQRGRGRIFLAFVL
ncbi:Do family serine endopeptidase [Myxococcota bacterium]|nr:Do family serine endopeptidase [Myxococcota bacterium]MBU1429349.1 Do family serine endopeptidase [Myxococcota bacterium]MBU1899593.1 Do family serine endopeptidase [Myxococcota bacterium]